MERVEIFDPLSADEALSSLAFAIKARCRVSYQSEGFINTSTEETAMPAMNDYSSLVQHLDRLVLDARDIEDFRDHFLKIADPVNADVVTDEMILSHLAEVLVRIAEASQVIHDLAWTRAVLAAEVLGELDHRSDLAADACA